MPSISFAEAWQAYRRAESRLPPKPPPVAPRRISGIAEIAADFDVIALDAWGVLTLGDTPIAGAREAVAWLRAAGKALAVLSNSGSRDADAASRRLQGLGFAIAAAEIINGLGLVPAALDALALPAPIGVIADPPTPLPALTRSMLPLGDDEAEYDRCNGIVFLSSDTWTAERQARLAASLARRPRPLIVGNPDISSPEPDGMDAEPGWYAHRIAEMSAVRPIFCGKPFPAIYAQLRRRFPDVPAERVLCVGDTPHTDILGGRAAGYRSLLIEDGFCRGRDALALAAESGIWPDFIAPGI